jgi:hypothetical protein
LEWLMTQLRQHHSQEKRPIAQQERWFVMSIWHSVNSGISSQTMWINWDSFAHLIYCCDNLSIFSQLRHFEPLFWWIDCNLRWWWIQLAHLLNILFVSRHINNFWVTFGREMSRFCMRVSLSYRQPQQHR